MTEGHPDGLSHLDADGNAVMVDVSGKPKVRRTAEAEGFIKLAPATLDLIARHVVRKGDVLTVAKIAAIMGAKKTSELIPLCHGIAIDHVDVEFDLRENGITIRSRAVCTDKTGIEMEALTAVSIAALTIYDMCKAVDRGMIITDLRLLSKTKENMKK